jgi:prolipoprotein diacylglyceryltransferase
VYAAFYTLGRFWTEYLRIDTAHKWLGLRLNDWTSIAVFVGSLAVLLIFGRAADDDERAGTPMAPLYNEAAQASAGLLPT